MKDVAIRTAVALASLAASSATVTALFRSYWNKTEEQQKGRFHAVAWTSIGVFVLFYAVLVSTTLIFTVMNRNGDPVLGLRDWKDLWFAGGWIRSMPMVIVATTIALTGAWMAYAGVNNPAVHSGWTREADFAALHGWLMATCVALVSTTDAFASRATF